MKHFALLSLLLLSIACDSTAPPGPSPQPPPTPSRVALTGTISATPGAGRVSGASVRIADGPNANRTTTTNANGEFRFEDLEQGNANVFASASGFEDTGAGVFVNGTNTLNLTMTRHLWRMTGSGNSVFDMPTWVSRVQIFGRWNGVSTSNFIVRLRGSTIVNEILRDRNPYEGTHVVTGGGVTETVNSSNITEWRFTEVR